MGEYVVDARVCKKCNESQLDVDQSQLVFAHNKYADSVLDGRLTTVGGTSYAVRIPKNLAMAYNLASGEEVTVKSVRPGVIEIKIHPAAERIEELTNDYNQTRKYFSEEDYTEFFRNLEKIYDSTQVEEDPRLLTRDELV